MNNKNAKYKFFMTKFLIANWKMNGDRAFIADYAQKFQKQTSEKVEYIIAPPSCYLDFTLQKFENRAKIAVQDVSNYESGAYTGQICAKMAHDLGAKYAIIGHSETRNSGNVNVLQKVKNAISCGLKVIYCIGESSEIRGSGVEKYQQFLCQQIDDILPAVREENFMIAYEPIWAIGTGNPASALDIEEISSLIRSHLAGAGLNNISILYGGSVTLQNATEILNIPNISGLLIGGMSLKWDQFGAIIPS